MFRSPWVQISDVPECHMLKDLDRNILGSARSRFPASTTTLAMLSSLLLTCIAVPLAGAQSVGAVKAPLSAETMATHLQAKRSVATPAANIEPPVTSPGSSSSFNSAQGPPPAPTAPAPRSYF